MKKPGMAQTLLFSYQNTLQLNVLYTKNTKEKYFH